MYKREYVDSGKFAGGVSAQGAGVTRAMRHNKRYGTEYTIRGVNGGTINCDMHGTCMGAA